jgi:hemolysin III
MDVAPIGILALGGGIALWMRALQSRIWGVIAVITCVVLPHLLARVFFEDQQVIISSGYAGLALGVLLGAVLAARRQANRGLPLLLLSGSSFAVAISFRILDRKVDPSWLPSGTHWLWHIAGAASVYYIMRYLIQSERDPFTNCGESRT